MNGTRLHRRWVVLVIVGVVALATIGILDQPLTLDSYREMDPRTLVVTGHGSQSAWTRVTRLAETETAVTITVNSFAIQVFPGTAAAYPIDVEVRLAAPLGGRDVIDGKTGQTVPPAP